MNEFCNKLVFERSYSAFVITPFDLRRLRDELEDWNDLLPEEHPEIFFRWTNYPVTVAFINVLQAKEVLKEVNDYYEQYPDGKYWIGLDDGKYLARSR